MSDKLSFQDCNNRPATIGCRCYWTFFMICVCMCSQRDNVHTPYSRWEQPHGHYHLQEAAWKSSRRNFNCVTIRNPGLIRRQVAWMGCISRLRTSVIVRILSEGVVANHSREVFGVRASHRKAHRHARVAMWLGFDKQQVFFAHVQLGGQLGGERFRWKLPLKSKGESDIDCLRRKDVSTIEAVGIAVCFVDDEWSSDNCSREDKAEVLLSL